MIFLACDVLARSWRCGDLVVLGNIGMEDVQNRYVTVYIAQRCRHCTCCIFRRHFDDLGWRIQAVVSEEMKWRHEARDHAAWMGMYTVGGKVYGLKGGGCIIPQIPFHP